MDGCCWDELGYSSVGRTRQMPPPHPGGSCNRSWCCADQLLNDLRLHECRAKWINWNPEQKVALRAIKEPESGSPGCKFEKGTLWRTSFRWMSCPLTALEVPVKENRSPQGKHQTGVDKEAGADAAQWPNCHLPDHSQADNMLQFCKAQSSLCSANFQGARCFIGSLPQDVNMLFGKTPVIMTLFGVQVPENYILLVE